MRLTEIDAELTAANPWWRNPDSWTESDVQLRAATRSGLDYDPRPLDDLSSSGLYVLRGPRRVGKSTALKKLISRRLKAGTPPRHILHISVEGRTAQDVADIVRRGASTWLLGDPGECLWVIDEITGVEGPWPETIKRLRDSDAHFSADTVILTGSSAARFDEARKHLAGRRHAERSDRTLFQMGFLDVCRAFGMELPASPRLTPASLADDRVVADAVESVRPWLAEMIEGWDRYLQVGGYPQAVAAERRRSGEEVADVGLRDALWDVIHGDAFQGSGLAPAQTQTLLRTVTASLGSLYSVQGLASSIRVAHATAGARLDALRRAFITFPVYREQGLAPRPQSQAKWYFTDPRLARLASEFGAGSPPDRTVLSEQQLAVALLRALENESPGAAVRHDSLLYYRSRTRAEIDFVSPAFPDSCVESKFVDRGWGRAFQTIEASGRRTGIVATRSGTEKHDGGWALPAALVAFLLGM
ncbi:MAG: AAA family ATPase [Longimicrobiales bacterium]|nr:AAA family ATPase [Longimicrobiales bacterium]